MDEPLYAYRLHGANTFAGLTLAGRLEGEIVLDRCASGAHADTLLLKVQPRSGPRDSAT